MMYQKLAALAVATVLMSVGLVASIGAAGPTQPLTAEQRAQKLLDRHHDRFMTASATQELARRVGKAGAFENPVRNEAAPALAARVVPGSTTESEVRRSQGPNIRVNDPARDTSHEDQTTQSETTVAVAGSNVVVGFNDSQHAMLQFTSGWNMTGYGYSNDGGKTFTDGGVLPNQPGYVNVGDPWLAADRAGNFYYSTLMVDPDGALGVGVAKSTDGGRTFGAPLPIHDPFTDNDKEAIAVGPDPAVRSRDNVYAAWDNFSVSDLGVVLGLKFSRSIDGGQTFQTTTIDSFTESFDPAAGCSFQQYIGAQPAVDPVVGTLYVTSLKISVDDPNCTFATPVTFSQWSFRSDDGGQTFGAGVKIADVTPTTANGNVSIAPGQAMRILEFPSTVARQGKVYSAWSDGASGNPDIVLATSNDRGATWSVSPVTSTADGDYQPSLAADNGKLHIAFYRLRNGTFSVRLAESPYNRKWSVGTLTDTEFGGVPNLPQFDPIIAPAYMGDYISVASDGKTVYAAWGDNRDKVVSPLWENGRHDPDVFFAKA